MAAAVRRLPPDDRWALSLVHDRGWTPAQVAALYNVKESTVARLLSRARRRLRDELGRLRDGAVAVAGGLVGAGLDRVHALVSLAAGPAATFSLVVAVAVGTLALAPGPGRQVLLPGTEERVGWVHPVGWAPGDMVAVGTAGSPARSATRPSPVLVAPRLHRQPYGAGSSEGETFVVDPVSAGPGPEGRPDPSVGRLGFECPSSEERFLLLAVGCALFEQTGS